MITAPMTRPRVITALAACAAAVAVSACGSQGIELAESDPLYEGAVLFAENCGGCHTLDAAGTEGSGTDIGDRERVDGPNFNTRPEEVDDVLYAIRNGGFSGAIMPENIATGAEKLAIASFLAKYAGSDVKSQTPTGGSGEGGTDETSPGGDESSPSEAPG